MGQTKNTNAALDFTSLEPFDPDTKFMALINDPEANSVQDIIWAFPSRRDMKIGLQYLYQTSPFATNNNPEEFLNHVQIFKISNAVPVQAKVKVEMVI